VVRAYVPQVACELSDLGGKGMSGIAGIFEPGRSFGYGSLDVMLKALALSGELGRQDSNQRSVALGVARRWGFQQLASKHGVTVAADADLIGIEDLAAVLSISKQAAQALSVAELIARVYLERGESLFTLLHGAFSIALWDEKESRLLLAIDRFGIKSLYYRQEGARTIFSSRLSAIRAVQAVPPEVHPAAALQFFLFSSVPAPLSIDSGTNKLRPGTFLAIQQGIVEHQYWDLEYPESDETNVIYWSNELRESMRNAVYRHLDGCEQASTGCYLSGGTDSSSVVAFASEKHQPAQSFSIAFAENGFSEIDFARTAARQFHTNHHERFLAPEDAVNSLEKIIAYYDEPFANSSAIGSYHCALLARENGVEALLAGDGGDELFGGNERYATDKRFALYQSIPAFLRRGLVEPFSRLLPDTGKLSLPRRYVRRANIPNPRRILSYGFFLNLAPEEAFDSGFLDQVPAESWLAIPEEHFRKAAAKSELNRILYLDIKMTLADNDLRKVSGTAEMAGVNVRYPLLDDRLAESSGRIPAKLKLRGFEKRYIFKQAMKGILPDKILYKKKHGFGVPVAQWLLGNARMREMTNDLLGDARTRERGYFRPTFFEGLRKLHAEQPNFYGEIVWYLLVFELWHRKHVERKQELAHA
jgi:asparagine synthase (glutamine-hydrolysing)